MQGLIYRNGAQRVSFPCPCLGPQHVAAGANFLLSQRPVCFFSFLPVSLDAKEWECPRVPPIIPPAQTGSRLGAKSMAPEEAARPPGPLCETAVSTSVGWARAG